MTVGATLFAALVVLLLAVLAWRLGFHVLSLAGGGHEPSAVPAWLAGWVTIHLLLTALQALGVPWTRWSVLLGVGAAWLLAAGAHRRYFRLGSVFRPRGQTPRFGWGDALAGLALAGFASAAWTLRSVNPDFIFHWGLKAKKFVLAGGVDFAYLARPWNHYTHPDYPTLLPELYAASSLLAGRFAEPALLLWSVLCFAALLWVAREWLAEQGLAFGGRQAGLALLALAVAAFGIGYLQAGGADLMIALGLVAGAAALGREDPDPRADLELGTAAAFAAASKIEGVVLAGFLVGLGLSQAIVRGQLSRAKLLRQLLPPVAVIGPWVALNLHHGLFQGTNTGSFDPSRLGAIWEALAASLAVPAWHGFPYLLALLPVLLVFRRSRWLAVLALLQLGLYLYVYVTTPVDPVFYVRSSFPRLLLHLVPAAILGAVAVLGTLPRGPTTR